mgnify:CR=1 FL=1
MIVHNHWMPPALIRLNNKMYLVPTWVEVPENTELKDIVWNKPKTKTTLTEVRTFVSSSNSDITYETKRIESPNGDVRYTCNCPGFWRAKDKRCKHVKNFGKKDRKSL